MDKALFFFGAFVRFSNCLRLHDHSNDHVRFALNVFTLGSGYCSLIVGWGSLNFPSDTFPARKRRGRGWLREQQGSDQKVDRRWMARDARKRQRFTCSARWSREQKDDGSSPQKGSPSWYVEGHRKANRCQAHLKVRKRCKSLLFMRCYTKIPLLTLGSTFQMYRAVSAQEAL